jgi:hypothetical protein
MSCKDGSAKQTEAYCDRFNHLDAPLLTIGTSSRSWFHADFFGTGKWFRLTPPAVRGDQSRYRISDDEIKSAPLVRPLSRPVGLGFSPASNHLRPAARATIKSG